MDHVQTDSCDGTWLAADGGGASLNQSAGFFSLSLAFSSDGL